MIRTISILVALFMTATAARADACYVIVFGAVSKPQRAKFSHSWAVFVRFPGCQPGEAPGPDSGPMEYFTISWLPEAVCLQPLALRAECGRNFDLDRTFQIVLSQCERVSAWGPYQICPEFYRLALCQKNRLERNEIAYKTIDEMRNPHRVSNCIHALTSFNPNERSPFVGRLNFGEVASYRIVDNYEDWIMDRCHVHCWVADLLGLNQWPVRWRSVTENRPQPRREP